MMIPVPTYTHPVLYFGGLNIQKRPAHTDLICIARQAWLLSGSTLRAPCHLLGPLSLEAVQFIYSAESQEHLAGMWGVSLEVLLPWIQEEPDRLDLYQVGMGTVSR